MGEFNHVSVLLNESVEGLNIKEDGVYVDGTTGGGGHSEKILKSLKTGKLICVDRDRDALDAAESRLKPFGDMVTFIHSDYKNLKQVVKNLGIDRVDGILLDLGVSSYQIDEIQRGFSYMAKEAPLDMRMDRTCGPTAADILNTYDEGELKRIIKEYGEEKNAGRIAKKIVETRNHTPFKTTGDLVEIIKSSVPNKKTGGHPAKRTFQALRIEVNEELNGLGEFILGLPELLNDGGRICIITFHSLEDRIVKQAFKKMQDPCECPKEFPVCVCGKKPSGVSVTRKPILPKEKEMEENSRSKSAKLRIFEKRKYEG